MTHEHDTTMTHFEEPNEPDLLISRLIDGEADDTDRRHFEDLASAEPSLWRQLALRQQDMAILTRQVRAQAAIADHIELETHHRLIFPLAWVGWAALIIVALAWFTTTKSIPIEGNSVPVAMSPEQHYVEYRQAPYVLGEQQPEILDVEELSDGRIAVRFIRRSEEVAFLDPEGMPLDEHGNLTTDPLRLREIEAAVPWRD